MPQISANDCQKLLQLTGELHSVTSAASLPQQFLRSLRPVIAYEFGGCHLLEPSRHHVASFSACPEAESLPLPFQHKDYWRLAQQNPLHRVALTKHSRAWKLSDVITRQSFQLTECYRTLYRPLKANFELAAAIPDTEASGTFLFIGLHRHKHDFTERDRLLFNLLLPQISAVRQRLAESSRAAATPVVSPLGDEQRFREWLQHRTRWELTQREVDVLFWLCQGKTNGEIGTILGIAERTAETHALHIYPKIGVENRYNAIATLSRLTNAPNAG